MRLAFSQAFSGEKWYFQEEGVVRLPGSGPAEKANGVAVRLSGQSGVRPTPVAQLGVRREGKKILHGWPSHYKSDDFIQFCQLLKDEALATRG
ncbi:DDB1- and CUL4-associated factor 16 isoform X2 [Phyllostomus discolor]|uniref:DDB1- and CUL4-associated factor 16 isoform X2 n=1 Tax=Phyllostomus discolor TaxID=89673 RepID=A0A7E6D787_9CHIR|nr:DDB1- and CUL4-associated factor 16 isoform X2 [Phyllostomus discolor]